MQIPVKDEAVCKLHQSCCDELRASSRNARNMDWSDCGSKLSVPAGVRRSAAEQACALIAANMPVFVVHARATSAASHEIRSTENADFVENSDVVSSHWWHFRVTEDLIMNEGMAQGKAAFVAGDLDSAMMFWRSVVNVHVRGEEAVQGRAGRLLVALLTVKAHLRRLAAQVRPAEHCELPVAVVTASLGGSRTCGVRCCG